MAFQLLPFTCPDVNTWLRLIRDEVAPDDRNPLEEHLERCDSCGQTYVNLVGGWSLASLLERRSAVEMGADTEALMIKLLNATGQPGEPTSRSAHPVEPGPPPEIAGLVEMQEIGRGGMGVVYRAHQPALQRDVAVKVLSPGSFSDALRARSVREARILGRLRHPNVVTVYGSGEVDGRPFIVMEYVEGGSLQDRIDASIARPSPREAAVLVRDLARAIAEVHAIGIIHRDLKPANVLLAKGPTSDAPHIPKLADFGLAHDLARPSGPGVTEAGMILGTPGYLAPEQIGLREIVAQVGPGTDIHGLGAILFTLLTGRPPYGSGNKWEALMRVARGTPDTLSRFLPRISRDLESIVARCLQSSPSRRYRSAAELAADLDNFIAGRPVTARPISGMERLIKWAKRRPAVASAMLVVRAALIGLFVVDRINLNRLKLEQAKTSAALVETERARDRALSALDTLTNETIQRFLDRGKVHDEKDRAYLGSVLNLLADPPSATETDQQTLRRAQGLERLGTVFNSLGYLEELVRAARARLSLLDELAARHPEIDSWFEASADLLATTTSQLEGLEHVAEATPFAEMHLDRRRSRPIQNAKDWERVANAYDRMGVHWFKRGRAEESIEALREAVALMRKAVVAAPDDVGLRKQAKRIALNHAAVLGNLGRRQEARAVEDDALAFDRDPRFGGSREQDDWGARLRLLRREIDDLLAAGNPAEALKMERQAFELVREQARRESENIQAISLLYVGCVQFSDLSARVGDPRAAEPTVLAWFESARARHQAKPAALVPAYELALASMALSRVRRLNQEFDQALALLDTAHEIAREWVAVPDAHKFMSSTLIECARHRENVLSAMNREDQALAHWEVVARICSDSDRKVCQERISDLRKLVARKQHPTP